MNPSLKIYLSGPIAGYDMDERKRTFRHYQSQLEDHGYEVVNPFDNGVPDNEHWRAHMRADIKMLLMCDGIYFLPEWEKSKGCKLEMDVATSCGIELIQVFTWHETKR